MKHATYFLTSSQYEWLADKLPEPTSKTKHAIPNSELLSGIVFVLRTGCRWSDIPASICTHHYSSCWRRLNFWRKRAGIKASWRAVLRILDHEGQIDLSLGNLDGTLVQAPNFKDCTGYSGKHHRTGTNVSVLTERDGLPLADSMAKGNRNDITSAERTVSKMRIGIKRRLKGLNADKGYDSGLFDVNFSSTEQLVISRNGSVRAVAGNMGHTPIWIKTSLSSGHLLSAPLPGSRATTDCGIGMNGRSVCFKPWLTSPVCLFACGGWRRCK